MNKVIVSDCESLLDGISYPIFVHDNKYKVVYANKAYIKLAHKPRNAVLNHVYWKSFPKKKGILSCCAPSFVNNIQEIEQPDGSIYKFSSFPIHINDQSSGCCVHFIEDITAQKDLLNQLEENNKLFHLMFEEAPDAMILHDKKGNIVLANKSACESLQYTNSELLSMSVFDIENSIPKKKLLGYWREIKNGKTISGIGVHKRKDKTEFPIEVNVQSLQINNNSLILVIARDMTEHQRLETLIKRRLAFEQLAQEIAFKLNDIVNLDKHLKEIVCLLGKFNNVDRCYIATYDEKSDLVSNFYGWCAPDIPCARKLVINTALKTQSPWLERQLKKFSTVRFNKVSAMPASAKELRATLKKASVVSVLFVPIFRDNILHGLIGFDAVKKEIEWQDEDESILNTVARLIAHSLHHEDTLKIERQNKANLQTILYKMIFAIMRMTEERDPYTAGHLVRVAALSKAIALALGFSKERAEGIYLGALVHDIGKIQIPSEILTSPKILSQAEISVIRTHPEAGYNILKDIPFHWPIKEIIIQHHERLNGSGYPFGLKKKDICIEARIVAVADVFESMVSHRPYRPAKGKTAAIKELEKNSGKLYDSKVVECCISLITKRKFKFPTAHESTQLFPPNLL